MDVQVALRIHIEHRPLGELVYLLYALTGDGCNCLTGKDATEGAALRHECCQLWREHLPRIIDGVVDAPLAEG